MRTSLYCLAIALLMRLTFDRVSAQSVELNKEPPNSHAFFAPGKIGLEWHFYEEHRVWLELNSFAKPDWPKDGWNPSYTVILCTYKPIVTRLEGGHYQITFESDLVGKGAGIP